MYIHYAVYLLVYSIQQIACAVIFFKSGFVLIHYIVPPPH